MRKLDINTLSGTIIGCAIEVHKLLGPGLLESTYQECLSYELDLKGLHIRREVPIPVVYKEIKLDRGFRVDLLVENMVLVELKTVEEFNPVHEAQILTYLKFAKKSLGLLINFNVPLLKEGIRRYRM